MDVMEWNGKMGTNKSEKFWSLRKIPLAYWHMEEFRGLLHLEMG
jgi:hypothetical protein